MKIVLSGATGYIGSQVLAQCLNCPSVTSVVILSRRDLGADVDQNPKAKVIILEDFTSYDEATADEVKSADAAIWCLGTKYGDEQIDIDFPLAFINIIKSRPQGSKQFRYVQLSGAFSEPSPKEGEKERSLWFLAHARRVRGATESKVFEMAEHEFTVFAVRPGGVFPGDGGILQRIMPTSNISIAMNDLTATMVDLAVHGSDQKRFLNHEIIEYGRRLRERSN